MSKFTTLFIVLFVILSCEKKKTDVDETVTSTPTVVDSTIQTVDKFQNERFRDVEVQKLDNDKYRVQGQAQVYEANVSWFVEDGHDVLKKGFSTATIGAPEWGNFDFTFEVKKDRANSTLTLFIFEQSAEDGSQRHELGIPLK